MTPKWEGGLAGVVVVSGQAGGVAMVAVDFLLKVEGGGAAHLGGTIVVPHAVQEVWLNDAPGVAHDCSVSSCVITVPCPVVDNGNSLRATA